MLKKISIAILSALALNSVAQAESSTSNTEPTAIPAKKSSEDYNKWKVRARLLWVKPNVSSSGLSNMPNIELTGVSNALVPEIDINYFWTKHISTELILATTRNSLTATGGTDLGEVWLLPPTITLLYHIIPDSLISPYLGAGINYTFFMQQSSGAAQSVDIDNAFGFALQAGLDFNIDEHWSLNADVKYIFLNTTGRVNLGGNTGTQTIDITLNPWLFGLGIGYSF